MKKRKILFQIGLVVFAVFLIITVASELYIYSQNINIYLTAKNEMIDKDLDTIGNNLRYLSIPDVVKYASDNSEKIKGQILYDEWMNLRERGYSDMGYPFDTSEKRNKYKKFFNSLDEKDKILLARNDCFILSVSLWSATNERGYDDAYIIYVNDDQKATVISADVFGNDSIIQYITNFASSSDASSSDASISDASEGTVLGSSLKDNLNMRYQFGQKVNYDFDDGGKLRKIIEKKENTSVFEKYIDSNNKAYYIGYHPVFVDNELQYIVCVEYDWTSVYTSFIGKATKNLVRDVFICVVFAAGLILVCLFFLTVKPLRQVKNAMELYKNTKKSEDVENSLSEFKSKNEIGELANHFRELTKEMDRYNDEIVALAEDKAKIKTELNVAADIQRQSLIKEFPQSDSFEVFASMTPAKEVGGDLYDIFLIDEDHLGLVIADVAGKGVPASLLMMAGMTAVRSYSTPDIKPSEVLTKVNESLVQRDIMDMFITIWMGILDTKTGILTTSSAGHEYPAINVNGRYEIFRDKHGAPAGTMSGIRYRDHEIQLKSGDSVFVYTDGVPEATNSEDELFNIERMLDALNLNPSASPKEVLENVKTAVDKFVGGAEQFDDLTMMCIRYKGSSL